MCPWMQRHIRLADRRGYLKGDLSEVQEFALQILMLLEDRDLEEANVRAVKAALVGNDIARMKDLFPEWFPTEKTVDADSPEAQAAYATGEYEEDFSAVKWHSPSDSETDIDDMLKLQEALLSASQVTMSSDEFGEWR